MQKTQVTIYNVCYRRGNNTDWLNIIVPKDKTKEEVEAAINYWVEVNERNLDNPSLADILYDVVDNNEDWMSGTGFVPGYLAIFVGSGYMNRQEFYEYLLDTREISDDAKILLDDILNEVESRYDNCEEQREALHRLTWGFNVTDGEIQYTDFTRR